MSDSLPPPRKEPGRVSASVDEKLLVSRQEAAAVLSISQRALGYRVARNNSW